jgi:hypothetical protein
MRAVDGNKANRSIMSRVIKSLMCVSTCELADGHEVSRRAHALKGQCEVRC